MSPFMNVGLMTEQMNIGGASSVVLQHARWLRRHGHTAVVFSAGGVRTELLSDAGIPHVAVPSFAQAPNFDVEQLVADGAAIRSAVEQFGLHAVLAQAQWPFAFAAAALRNCGVPLFFHILSPVYWPPKTPSVVAALQDAARDNRVFSTGASSTEAFCREFGVQERIPLLNVPIERLAAPGRTRELVRAEIGVATDAVVVLCVARLDHDRAPSIPPLADAIATLSKTYSGLQLVVVGNGAEMQNLRQRVGRKAIFTGYRTDLDDLYRAADIFVSEGSVVQEAARAGIPCVATNTTMFRKNGDLAFSIFGMHVLDHFFVVPNPVIAPVPIEEALRLLLQNPQPAREIGAAGARAVEIAWNPDTIMAWELSAFAGNVLPIDDPSRGEVTLSIAGGDAGDAARVAAVLAAIEKAHRFSVVADAPVRWTKFFEMPLAHAQALSRASWRSVPAGRPVFRLRNGAFEGPPGSLLSELQNAARVTAP